MNDFNFTKRVEQCRENDFSDLLNMFNTIMLSIIETDVPQYHFKAELIHWCHNVDNKLDAIKIHKAAINQLTADSLIAQTREVFGTEV
tara:strand:+ start:488 stop:751 length:264 start_codon:yes stop_codon:yes gene_type:complete